MNEPLYRYLEVSVYAVLNMLPCLMLALYPFRRDFRFSVKGTGLLVGLVICVQVITGILSCFVITEHAGILSLLSTTVYALFYFFAVKAHWGKRLFTLLMLSNIANFIVTSSKCLEGFLFGAIAQELYRWTHSLSMLIVDLIIMIPLYFYFKNTISDTMSKHSTETAWRYLWLIPCTFYLVWYYQLYSQSGSPTEVCLNPMTTVFLGSINLGALLIYHLIMRLINEQEKLRELEIKNHQLTLQQLQYSNLQDRITEARRAKHDIRHHITVLRALSEKGDLAQLNSYLDQYQSALPSDTSLQFCQNSTINLLLLYFAQQAMDNSIDYDVRVSFPEEIDISQTDLSVLIGNLLENAIQGCEGVPEEQRKITVRGKMGDGSLFLSVTNPYHGPLKRNADGSFQTTKKKGSGLGLNSVETITERYQGVLEIEPTDDMFCASVMLNISSHAKSI